MTRARWALVAAVLAPAAVAVWAEPRGGPAVPAPILPSEPGSFAPAHTARARIGDAPPPGGTELAEVETCAVCHADVAAQWRTSAHSFASFNNPIYRVSVDGFRESSGNVASHFCAGCHDLALMTDGAMQTEVTPQDRRAHAGITCRMCHGIVEVRSDGNGSFTLGGTIELPREGDLASVARHKAAAAPAPLRTAAQCGTCHRAFLGESTGNGHHLPGADDLTAWLRSAYAGSLAAQVDDPVAAAECRTCHMPLEAAPLDDAAATDGKVASHRFLGGHTWLAAMRGDRDQIARYQELLAKSVSIDVASVVAADGTRTLPADGAPVVAGAQLRLGVVVRNLGVGHRFPGGTLDAQDVWVEVEVHDARGRLVAEAGLAHEASGDDPTAHRLRAVMIGDDGQPLLAREAHRFRTIVYNHALPARDCEVVEYDLAVPEELAAAELPLGVTARLRHRSRGLPVQEAACTAARSPRGRAFAAAARKAQFAGPGGRGLPFEPAPLDPCPPQPVLTIAERTVWIGAGAAGRRDAAAPPAWRRLLDHGRGMLHAVQERLDEARASLLAALVEVQATGTPYEQAMVQAALAQVAARQGRTAEALSWLDQAAVGAPGHPALARIRGDALARVWRFDEAVGPLAAAAEAAPLDDSGWVALAVARGSRGDDLGALAAVARGLVWQPRDPDLLRVQALALDDLGAPAADAAAAEAAYLTHRTRDDAPRLRAMCSKSVAGCARERNPVHAHELRPARR